jgi:hypothetical protein
LSYASVFAPIGGEPSTAQTSSRDASAPTTPWLRILVIMAVFVAMAAVVLVLLGVFPGASPPLPKTP